jgi:hypothetical protein
MALREDSHGAIAREHMGARHHVQRRGPRIGTGAEPAISPAPIRRLQGEASGAVWRGPGAVARRSRPAADPP